MMVLGEETVETSRRDFVVVTQVLTTAILVRRCIFHAHALHLLVAASAVERERETRASKREAGTQAGIRKPTPAL